jgi:hypothetical protein
VTKKELLPVNVERIAVTLEQVRKYSLPPIRVKKSDGRARRYIQTFGDRAWEVEALPPQMLLRIVRERIKENIPKELI